MNKLAAAAAAAALILTAAASPALAQSIGSPPPPEEKSEQTALGLSLLGTIAPFAITLAAAANGQDELATAGAIGMLVGPSLGHWYAGKYVTGGLVARGAGVALVFVAAAQALSQYGCEGDCGGDDGETLAVAGLVAFVGGTLYDLATAGRAAREWNEEHLDMVGPIVVGSASGPVPGVGVAGSF